MKISKSVLAALILFIVIVSAYSGLVVQNFSHTPTPQVLILGDSILGSVRDETGVGAKLEEYFETQSLDLRVYNGALGGTTASESGSQFNLLPILQSAIAGDFAVQSQYHKYANGESDFPQVLKDLEKIDLKQVRYIVLCYGMNDYHSGAPIEDLGKPLNTQTYKGALRTAIGQLKWYCPQAQIILVTPTFSWYVKEVKTCQQISYGGGVLEDYVTALGEVAEEEQLLVLDLYYQFYPKKNFWDYKKYTTDGIHPNAQAREYIAERLGSFIQEHYILK